MNLFLTSVGLKSASLHAFFVSLLPKNPQDRAALIVSVAPTALELGFIEEIKGQLQQAGIRTIDVCNLLDETFTPVRHYDVIHVCGGNTFEYLERMRKLGVDTFIQQEMKNPNALYVGVSAGSILAGPSIELAGWGSAADSNDKQLSDFTGLGFTNIAVFPHYVSGMKEEIESFRTRVPYPIVPITDDEAVVVTPTDYHVIR